MSTHVTVFKRQQQRLTDLIIVTNKFTQFWNFNWRQHNDTATFLYGYMFLFAILVCSISVKQVGITCSIYLCVWFLLKQKQGICQKELFSLAFSVRKLCTGTHLKWWFKYFKVQYSIQQLKYCSQPFPQNPISKDPNYPFKLSAFFLPNLKLIICLKFYTNKNSEKNQRHVLSWLIIYSLCFLFRLFADKQVDCVFMAVLNDIDKNHLKKFCFLLPLFTGDGKKLLNASRWFIQTNCYSKNVAVHTWYSTMETETNVWMQLEAEGPQLFHSLQLGRKNV